MSTFDSARAIANNLLRRLRWQSTAVRHGSEPPPIFVTHTPHRPKVHLGAGDINLQGWINVDARPMSHIHIRTESLALNEFSDGHVGAVYICHVLEHLSFAEASSVLTAIARKLAVGGEILVSVPDFDALIEHYEACGRDLDAIKLALMGGQGYEYNFHKSVYNRSSLEATLRACGFTDARPWDPLEEFGRDVGDWSTARFKGRSGTIPLSLNLKATRSGGAV
ncbi:MAG TPA: hypothetical protein VEC39_16105 [Vicinamibacterales bacterium]|nr:hypothetical protein [Vicinamibacterales bacterium]